MSPKLQRDILKLHVPGDWPKADRPVPARDHDDDRLYRRRRAWRRAKDAFGADSLIGRSMLRLEELAGDAHVRELYAAALDHFVSATREERLEILRGYFDREEAREKGQQPTPSADFPELGRVVVAGQSWPVVLAHGRVYLEGVLTPGYTDFDGGRIVISDLSSRKQVAEEVGHGFVNLLADRMEHLSGKAAGCDDVPGVEDGDFLADPDDEDAPAPIPLHPTPPPAGTGGGTGEWEDVSAPAASADCQLLTKRLPRNRVPVLARPGHVVSLFNRSEEHAVIVEVTPHNCLVETEGGEQFCLLWHEVELGVVAPDPEAMEGRKAA